MFFYINLKYLYTIYLLEFSVFNSIVIVILFRGIRLIISNFGIHNKLKLNCTSFDKYLYKYLKN